MSAAAAATLKTVRTWPMEDQLELLYGLWDQLDETWIPTPDSGLLAELDRRVADAEKNPDQVYTWEQVMDYVKGNR